MTDAFSSPFALVAIAGSSGSLGVLEQILGRLPRSFPAPIVIVRHLSATSAGCLPRLLGFHTALPVSSAVDGECFVPGRVYVAPPDVHVVVKDAGRCTLSRAERVNFARPAADPLFTSAAEVFGARTLGVVLSGRLHDGARGAAVIRAAGGTVIAQDPRSCTAPSMPRSVIDAGNARYVLGPHGIGAALVSLTMVPGATALFGAAQSAA